MLGARQPVDVQNGQGRHRYELADTGRLPGFIHGLRYEDLPGDVIAQAKRCLIDLIGIAGSGTLTDLSRIIRDHAARQFGGVAGSARMLVDGRRVSVLGAAMAGGMTIDSMDGHDGHKLTKGHVGVAVLPGLLAFVDAGYPIDGHEFLTCLVLGYEIGTRAGIALHGSVPDYHTSGAWNALACAGLGARVMGLDAERTRHALGIAEYHGPRSQMMRCIDYPTMVKDGSGWGAMAGASAALLAADGFTGAPAVSAEGPDVAEVWRDLGRRWQIMEQYFKLYPVCRWAQPAVEAALMLQRQSGLAAAEIAAIEVVTFHEGTRLAEREPASTEAAQYSLPFPVAAALVHGRLGPEEVTGQGLRHPHVLRVSRATTLAESADYNARFPAERWAHVTITTTDGRSLASRPMTARGDPEAPLPDSDIVDKFQAIGEPRFGAARCKAILEAVSALSQGGSTAALLDLILAPVS
ncbi:MAG: MmgE/PrpD family protein [Alphaproteobacteria bacterium]|nr:MmgE/PrpD family protein [Alphaproteobacteria bacterium]